MYIYIYYIYYIYYTCTYILHYFIVHCEHQRACNIFIRFPYLITTIYIYIFNIIYIYMYIYIYIIYKI